MPIQQVLSQRRGQALILTFNRPEQHNALTLDMANQLFTILKNATTDPGVRAVMLCGAGNCFMDGLDMQFYAGDFGAALEHANQLVQPYHSAIRELQSMDKPVLSAVEGRITGPGMSFMLASDLVIAARSATFVCGFTENALSPNGGASYFLPRRIGASHAMEMFMMNEPIDAHYADKVHLVNRVADDDKLQEESLAWIDALAAGPTRAYGAAKKLVMRSFEQDLNAHLGLEHTYYGHTSRSFDFREAVKAFFAKRPPHYTGA